MPDPTLHDPTATEPLFRGAARLGLMLGALDLPWQRVAPVVASFPSELRDDLALAWSSGPWPLWLRTRGDGKAFTHRVTHFLEERGVAQPTLRRLLVSAAHWQHRHLLLELGVDQGGVTASTWAVRRAISLDDARAWLAAAGADTTLLARLGLVADALERPHLHAVGERTGPDGRVQQRLSFVQEAEGENWGRLDQALDRCGLSTDVLAPLRAHMPALVGRGCRLHLLVQDGVPSGAELDVDGLARTDLERILGQDSRQIDPLRTALALAQRDTADRAVLAVSSDQPLVLTAWNRVQEVAS